MLKRTPKNLTLRERRVCSELVRHCEQDKVRFRAAIAGTLGISEKTVDTHLTNIKAKWNCHSTIALVIRFLKRPIACAVVCLSAVAADTNSVPALPVAPVFIRSGTNALVSTMPYTNKPVVVTIGISEHYPLVKEHDLLGNCVGRELWDTQAYGNTVVLYTDGTDAGRYFSAKIAPGSTNRGDNPWTPGFPP